jgi:very-short-patch-repair endonuclease
VKRAGQRELAGAGGVRTNSAVVRRRGVDPVLENDVCGGQVHVEVLRNRDPESDAAKVRYSRWRHELNGICRVRAALWQCIRGCRTGVWFRRQVLIGRYVVDFVASSAQLWWRSMAAITRRVTADARRDRVLTRLGYQPAWLPR